MDDEDGDGLTSGLGIGFRFRAGLSWPCTNCYWNEQMKWNVLVNYVYEYKRMRLFTKNINHVSQRKGFHQALYQAIGHQWIAFLCQLART